MPKLKRTMPIKPRPVDAGDSNGDVYQPSRGWWGRDTRPTPKR
jgi:hypothetical protein